MICNCLKTCCMICNHRFTSKIALHSFPPFTLNDNLLQYVTSFKYLGHIICYNLCDNDDVNRKICFMFVCANTLFRKFKNCSIPVKCQIYWSFCLCMYGSPLWLQCSSAVRMKFRSCFNTCMNFFFWLQKI